MPRPLNSPLAPQTHTHNSTTPTPHTLPASARSHPAGRCALQVAFIGVKVYAVVLYVEAEKMARELGVRNRQAPLPAGPAWLPARA